MTTPPSLPAEPLQVTCTVAQAADYQVEYRITNIAASAVHIFDSKRMPYLILQQDGSLLLLHGVNPPDPDRDYGGIDIPLTRPVRPGEVVVQRARLSPLRLMDHYQEHRVPADLHGKRTLRCQVGWGSTPIVVEDRGHSSINTLLAWQRLASALPIEVQLP